MPKTIILNDYTGPHKEILNLLIIIAKQYIYSKKCFEEIPIFPGCMFKPSYWYFIDSTFNTNKVRPYYKKWNNIFLKNLITKLTFKHVLVHNLQLLMLKAHILLWTYLKTV